MGIKEKLAPCRLGELQLFVSRLQNHSVDGVGNPTAPIRTCCSLETRDTCWDSNSIYGNHLRPHENYGIINKPAWANKTLTRIRYPRDQFPENPIC
ncbi:unnamed protein product [Prunus armeniaca]|uniref:Uncharacterized protein n=1 Tax=Prunus armeniaca TaxID=36596 RepID=A0A6J5TWH1_PRUAR|nr:unnamed protein product [Prunus armeniaca]